MTQHHSEMLEDVDDRSLDESGSRTVPPEVLAAVASTGIGANRPPTADSSPVPASLRRTQRAVALARASLAPGRAEAAPAAVRAAPAGAEGSIPPQASSITPAAAPRRIGPIAMLLGGVALLLVGAVATLTFDRWVRATGSELTVHAIDNAGAPAKDARIFIDGALTCVGSECRVDPIEAGSHSVRVEAAGTVTEQRLVVPVRGAGHAVITLGSTATTAVVTQTEAAAPALGREAIFDIVQAALALRGGGAAPRGAGGGTLAGAAPASGPPPERAPEAEPASAPASPSSMPSWLAAATNERDIAASPASIEPAAAPRARKDAAPPAGKGTIQIASAPAANIVVDGRTTGIHQAVSVHVEPGVHVVAFVHPEFGRKVRTVRVVEGAVASASMQFP